MVKVCVKGLWKLMQMWVMSPKVTCDNVCVYLFLDFFQYKH